LERIEIMQDLRKGIFWCINWCEFTSWRSGSTSEFRGGILDG
jgi:hypothetical protein